MRLPAELRNRIWEYTLAGHTIRPYIDRGTLATLRSEKTTIKQPLASRFSLLRVCRRIYVESAVLPYTLSVFSFLRCWEIHYWVREMAPDEFALASNVRLLSFGDLELHPSFPPSLPKLERMEVHLEDRVGDNCWKGTVQEYQDDYEQRYGIVLDVIPCYIVCWIHQWARGDEQAKCSFCRAREVA